MALKEVLNIGDVQLGWEAHYDDEEPATKSETKVDDSTEAALDKALPETPEEEDKSRRLGDSAMYGFYAKAAGRHLLFILCIAMAVYAFCQSFPSMLNF